MAHQNGTHAPLPRMLVIDDEPVITFALSTYFSVKGFEVNVAAEREEALALLARDAFEVVIADLRLTGTDGEEGLDLIREARLRNPSAGVVLLTAYGSDEVRARALSAGADAVLSKPKPLPELAAAVHIVMEARA